MLLLLNVKVTGQSVWLVQFMSWQTWLHLVQSFLCRVAEGVAVGASYA